VSLGRVIWVPTGSVTGATATPPSELKVMVAVAFAVTVRVAAVVVAVPAELVNTASYSYPLCDEEAVKE
jgi:hypothetical protein